MKCPLCEAVLVMTVRQDVEIDYCPTCRGVWLDRGELDKLIAIEQRGSNTPPGGHAPRMDDSDVYPQYRSDYRQGKGDGRPAYPKKKESIWSNLFDFD